MFFALYFSFHLYIQRQRDVIRENNLFSSHGEQHKKKGREEEETHNRPSKLNISARFHGENIFSGLQSNLLGVGVILVKSGVRKTN